MKTTIIGMCALLLGLLGLLAGCNSCNSAKNETEDDVKNTSLETLVLDSCDRVCVDKVNELAFAMLHQIAKDHRDSSFVVSPLSLACAIAITGNGAKGATLDEIEGVVGPIDGANSFFKKYIAALPHNDKSKCDLMNYFAVNSRYSVKKEYADSISKNYGACVEALDFASPQSAEQINQWFCKQSNDSTMNVVERLNPAASYCLFDALDFHAFWGHPFEEGRARVMDFTTDSGKLLQIPIMNKTTEFPFIENMDYQTISLPYSGSLYRMLIVLPKNEKLAQFSEKMTSEKFTDILNSFTTEIELSVYLPRFKYEVNIAAEKLLKKIMPTAYDMELADFSNICDGDLAIKKIVHKTSIEVNEIETKARSTTMVGMEKENLQNSMPTIRFCTLCTTTEPVQFC